MNARSFKVIFSKRLGALVAVGENATSQGKGASGEATHTTNGHSASSAVSYIGALKTLCMAAVVVTAPKAFALDANALPSGGEVRHGAATVGSVGATMTINQTSSRATINWQSFNVGSGAKVNIVQPSSSAALLNRVVGNEMSQIHGQINANGQVVLVNPNGVLVGSSGSITASAFTATTFGISDADFNAGNMRLSRNGSSASVVNQGTINTQGDYVALIGASVSNSGTISTSGGNAMLGAGDAVSIPLAGNIRLELAPAAFASVDNSGTITTAGGQVFMRASAVVDAVSKVANATVTHSGTINTSGGRVDILADHGTVRVSGTIVGSKPVSTETAETAADTETATEAETPAEETSNADTPASPTTTDTESTPSTAETSEPEAVAEPEAIVEPEAAAEPQAVAEPATPPAPEAVAQPTTPPAVADTPPAPSTPVVVAAEPQPEPTSSPVSAPVSTSTETTPASSTPVVLEVPKVPTAPDVGGSIFIGRDETTNVLAAVGDVRGAFLESTGGFVETSGDHLKTDGVTVKAKEWLLDPSDIIIANSASSNVTGTSPGDIVPTGGTGTSSIVQVSTIQSAINAGTSVTIKTTNVLNPTGAGNITIADPLAFTNNGAQDATLSLIADNGITQNAAITTSGGSRRVHISMTANGNFRGNPGANTSSRGIVINRNIITNGDITLTATIDNPSTNTEAIRFNNTTISARKYTIIGTHNNTATASHGVVFNGTNTFTATEDSSIRGVTRGGSWPPSMGVYYLNGSNTTFNSGNGRTSVVGVLTGSGSTGTRVSFDSGANITTNSSGSGSVTLGSNETGASFFHRRGTIRAATGTLNILGTSITTYEPNAIIQGDNGSTINLRANSIEFGTSAGGSSVIRPSAANGGFNLNIATDRLVVLAGSTTSSGTGTTTIQGFSNGTQIDLGGTDATGKLGITNAELNSFTARNLVVGNSTNTGGITVSGPITTLASTGPITLRTGGSIALNAALTVGFVPPQTPQTPPISTLTLDAGGAISSNSDGKLIATGLVMNAGTTIGASGSGAIKTAVDHASLSSGGAQFLVEDNAVTISAKTTGNGNINITTTNGTMMVGSFNGVSGIDAGTGNVGLTANSGSGHGILMSSDVKGKDITVDATANNGTGLGFYGAGGSFTASGTLNLTGTATGTGNGFYSFGGTHTAQTGINITGTSANGQGVGFDRNVVLTNASNDIVITGTSNGTGTNPEAIGLRGSSITNTNGNIKLVAAKGNVLTNSEGGTPGQYWGLPGPLTNTITNNGTGEIQILAGSTKTDTGAIDGKVLTINQNGNGGVLVKTTGDGNVIAPKITNAGTGNVVIAAGSLKDAGDGSGGGQVLTSSSSPVTQISTGKTFIYSGNAAGTGVLSNIDNTLSALKIDGTTNQNADTNAAFGTGAGITGSNAKAQAIFREKLTVANGVLADATLVKTYGDESTKNTSGAALLAEAKGALKNAAANSGTNSTFATAPEGTKNRIVVSKSAIVDTLTDTLTDSAFSNSGFLKANTTDTYKFAGMSSTKYEVGTGIDVIVHVTPKAITLGGITAENKVYDGSTTATVNTTAATFTGMETGDILTVVSSAGAFDNKNVGTGKTVTLSNTLGGADLGNYTITNQSTTSANVTPKAITLGGITAENKVYDGSTTATVNTAAATFNGMVTGDNLSVISSAGTFDNKNVGTGKTVTLSNTLGGADLENYTVTNQASTTGSITPRPATISATPTQLTFTGTPLNQAAPTTSNLVDGDDLTVNGVATGQAEGTYRSALAVTGGDAGNYTFTLTNADLVITAKPFIPPVNLDGGNAAANLNGARGSATLAAGFDTGFQLASAEQGQGQCTQDTLSFCECETAKDDEGLNIDGVQLCFEPQRGAEPR